MSCDFSFTRSRKFLIKHIFNFHIIKKIIFIFYYPDNNHLRIPKGSISTGTGMTRRRVDRCRRRCSEPTNFRPASWSGHPTGTCPMSSQPAAPLPAFTNFTRCQFHSCPYLIPPDSIHHNGIYPHDSRLWRSLTGVITVNTSNYTRNTYIYYYIYI